MTHRQLMRHLTATAALIGALGPHQAQAAFSCGTDVSLWENGTRVVRSVSPGGSFDCVSSASYGSMTAHASAVAGHGTLKVVSDGVKLSQAPGALPQRATASASAQFSDTVTIGSPSYQNQTGYLHFFLAVSGWMESPLSTVTLNTRGANFRVAREGGDVYLTSTGTPNMEIGFIPTSTPYKYLLNSTYPKFFNYAVDGYFSFTIGQPFNLFTSLATYGESGSSEGRGAANWDSNFGNSLYWGGITRVTLGSPEGAEIPLGGLSLASLSGTNWMQSFVPAPVPVPAALPLLLSAVGLMGWFVRRGS